ncbi:MAG: hypothetical protein P8Y44_06890 [Acidobacteriota bacterium]
MKSKLSDGFSLVELLVSLLLVTLILTLSVRLLMESQIVFQNWQRLAPQPIARLGEGLIRADVQGASRVESALGSWLGMGHWSADPLVLVYADGRRVRYDAELGTLVRLLESEDRGVAGARPMLHGVVDWRWRLLEGAVVEIDLAYSRPRDPGSRVAGSRAMRQARERRLENLRLTYALRDRPGRQSW